MTVTYLRPVGATGGDGVKGAAERGDDRRAVGEFSGLEAGGDEAGAEIDAGDGT